MEQAVHTERATKAAAKAGERAWRAASYARLSVDDGDRAMSSSITSQQRIIDAYAESHGDVTIVGEFVDDGWSGSNFERPGFRDMMAAVDNGEVDCVVVKDLSRFGRNYLEVGYYLERVFPTKGVRMIAVTDSYDSLREGSCGLGFKGDDALVVPFKNLVNDWYCANASAKTRDALAVRRREGMFVGAFAAYGYLKDPADRNALVADPVAAPVVRRIFELRASGKTLAAIADALNRAGVLAPTALKEQRGCKRPCGAARPAAGGPLWHASQVGKLLRNETYCGVLVQGKSFSPSFRGALRLGLPPGEWTRVEGACPALVSRELFDAVQGVRGRR